LAPAVPTDQVVGNTLAESEQVMLAFADLHAQWWNNPILEQLTWTAPLTHVQPIEESLRLLNESIASAAKTGRFDAYPNLKKLQPLLPPLFKMTPPPPEPFTLVHGDLRSDNIFFMPDSNIDCSKPIIIDWQTAGTGQPMTDIARWLTQSISIEQRQNHEHDLLKRYHDRLVANGVKDYSYKKMLQEYEINLVITLLMFSMSMDEIDQSSERAAKLFHAMYSRLDAALADWPVEKTLKILPMLIPFMKIGVWFKTHFKSNTA
jgi:thiamine kinase-like enzyme